MNKEKPQTWLQWMRGESLSQWFTVVILITGALYARSTGYLDARRERLELEKLQLQRDIEAREKERAKVERELAELRPLREEQQALESLQKNKGFSIRYQDRNDVLIALSARPDIYSGKQGFTFVGQDFPSDDDVFSHDFNLEFESLQYVTGLTGLELLDANVGADELYGLQKVTRARKLKRIRFDSCVVKSDAPKLFAQLPDLKFLVFSNCRFESIPDFSNASSITSLVFHSTVVADEALRKLPVGELTALDLSTAKLTSGGLSRLAHPNLVWLAVSLDLSDDEILTIKSQCPELEYLFIINTKSADRDVKQFGDLEVMHGEMPRGTSFLGFPGL